MKALAPSVSPTSPSFDAGSQSFPPPGWRRVADDTESGGGRVRTSVGFHRQIYSLLPLTTRAPLQYLVVKPGMGVEPITCGLQDRCSAVEPPRRSGLGDRSEATGIVASHAVTVKILVHPSASTPAQLWPAARARVCAEYGQDRLCGTGLTLTGGHATFCGALVGESSNGRTAASGAVRGGSNPPSPTLAPSSSGLGRGILDPETGVRLPLGL